MFLRIHSFDNMKLQEASGVAEKQEIWFLQGSIHFLCIF